MTFDVVLSKYAIFGNGPITPERYLFGMLFLFFILLLNALYISIKYQIRLSDSLPYIDKGIFIIVSLIAMLFTGSFILSLWRY